MYISKKCVYTSVSTYIDILTLQQFGDKVYIDNIINCYTTS